MRVTAERVGPPLKKKLIIKRLMSSSPTPDGAGRSGLVDRASSSSSWAALDAEDRHDLCGSMQELQVIARDHGARVGSSAASRTPAFLTTRSTRRR